MRSYKVMGCMLTQVLPFSRFCGVEEKKTDRSEDTQCMTMRKGKGEMYFRREFLEARRDQDPLTPFRLGSMDLCSHKKSWGALTGAPEHRFQDDHVEYNRHSRFPIFGNLRCLTLDSQ